PTRPRARAAAEVALAASAVLEQCAGFLDALPDADYARASRSMMGSTIGQHVRHAIDHFNAALACLEDDIAIDYDHRARRTPVENDRAEGARVAARLAESLASVSDADAARSVRVRVMLSGDGREAELYSTLARELAFAAHHAVHHHAMIAAIAAEFGHTPPAGFGKAPSTLNYEQSR
ncbi:MAG: DinB family protein, partial [Planctomycetota bacterium]|nr:DinB family protein [Planctomycetota bacterium]